MKNRLIATAFAAALALGISGYGGHSSAVSLNDGTQHATSVDDREAAVTRSNRSALWSRQDRWVWFVSRCIREHESINVGHYDAVYPDASVSTASGAYQMIDSTWRHYAQHTKGAHKYARAVDAPPFIQDRVFLKAVKWDGLGHWKGTGCPGTG